MKIKHSKQGTVAKSKPRSPIIIVIPLPDRREMAKTTKIGQSAVLVVL